MTIRADRIVDEDVTLSYRTFNDTAFTGTGDYEFTNGQVTISAGRNQTILPITVFDDNVSESNERFTLRLQSVTTGDAIIDNASGIVTIVDNDPSGGGSSGGGSSEPALPVLSARSIFVGEGSLIANVVIDSDRVVSEDVTVSFRTTVGTARSSEGDYIFREGNVTMRAGRDAVTVPITIIDDDRIEGEENFFLSLQQVNSNNAIIDGQSVRITIVDNDEEDEENDPQPAPQPRPQPQPTMMNSAGINLLLLLN